MFFIAAIVCVVVFCSMVGTGVLKVHDSKDEAGITIDKKELKEKTHEAVRKAEEAGSEVLDKTRHFAQSGGKDPRPVAPSNRRRHIRDLMTWTCGNRTRTGDRQPHREHEL